MVEEENKTESSEEESLELDKLEVSAKKEKSEPPPVATESSEKTEAPPKTRPSLFKNLASMVMRKAFLVSLGVGLIVGAVMLFVISSDPPQPNEGDPTTRGTAKIVYEMASPIGLGHHVVMQLSVPFKDTEERNELMKQLAKLKRELPSATRSPEVIKAINKRDLQALQEEIVKIVCHVTGLPSEKVGLDIHSLK